MKIVSKPWRLLRWNIGCAALCLGLSGLAVTPDTPRRIAPAELRQMRAGSINGSQNAVNVDPEDEKTAKNSCYYCKNFQTGSFACLDVAQILEKGLWKYTSTQSVSCYPVTQFSGFNCTGNKMRTLMYCNSSKTHYIDP